MPSGFTSVLRFPIWSKFRAILFQFSIQSRFTDAEQLGGRELVPTEMGDGSEDGPLSTSEMGRILASALRSVRWIGAPVMALGKSTM